MKRENLFSVNPESNPLLCFMLLSIAYHMLMSSKKESRNTLKHKQIEYSESHEIGLFECEVGLFEYNEIA